MNISNIYTGSAPSHWFPGAILWENKNQPYSHVGNYVVGHRVTHTFILYFTMQFNELKNSVYKAICGMDVLGQNKRVSHV